MQVFAIFVALLQATKPDHQKERQPYHAQPLRNNIWIIIDGIQAFTGLGKFSIGGMQKWSHHDFEEMQWKSIKVPLSWVDSQMALVFNAFLTRSVIS
tara:strand:+ start:358 stop:648 length:291 start_codon:yes stop_codon:yes gene_type:complete